MSRSLLLVLHCSIINPVPGGRGSAVYLRQHVACSTSHAPHEVCCVLLWRCMGGQGVPDLQLSTRSPCGGPPPPTAHSPKVCPSDTRRTAAQVGMEYLRNLVMQLQLSTRSSCVTPPEPTPPLFQIRTYHMCSAKSALHKVSLSPAICLTDTMRRVAVLLLRLTWST